MVERRTSVLKATSTVRLYAMLAVGLAATMFGSIVLISIFSPENKEASDRIAQIGTPIILALIANGLHGMAVSVDGRLSQLMKANADKERAEGKVEGLQENPKLR